MREFALIERFVRLFDVPPSPFGPGDDCAVLPSMGRSCVTTDAVVEGVHFTRQHFSFADVGHKALAVNLSDLAAMGAVPRWFTVALALPADVTLAQVLELGRGMARLAKRHGIVLVGGNVTAARELSVTITAAGEVKRPLLRSGAKVGDGVYVSGPLGDAAGGLRQLTRGARGPARLLAAQRRPHPHVAFGRALRGLATAAIDVSDGLLQDVGHLALASRVGIELNSESMPLSRALVTTFSDDALELALRGGEDYVLAFTAPSRHHETLLAWGAHRVGVVTRGAGVRLDGKTITGRAGHQHR